MEFRKALTTAIGLAKGAAQGISNYASVGACHSGNCLPISVRTLYYRLDEIEKYVKEHHNELLLISDTYFVAYTEKDGYSYIVLIGGHDGIANDIKMCRYSLSCILNGIIHALHIKTNVPALDYFYNNAYTTLKRTVMVVFRFKE